MPELKFSNRREIGSRPRLFFCDVDRTILTHGHVLLPEVAKGLLSLSNVGLPLILASARSPVGLERIHPDVGACDIVCCFNGAWVGRLSTRETLSEERLERELAVEALAIVHEIGGSPIWYDLAECFVLRPDEAIARQRTNVTGDIVRLIDKSADAPGAPFKLLATFPKNRIDEAAAHLSMRLSRKLNIAQSGPNLIELVPKTARKDLAAAYIASRIGWQGEDVAAAGDSDNDAEMLSWAGLSITVANAKSHIQELADIVAPSCDEGGLAVALRWLVKKY